jgi:hypothetical protein
MPAALPLKNDEMRVFFPSTDAAEYAPRAWEWVGSIASSVAHVRFQSSHS